MRIVEFGKIVFIDGCLELITNALYDGFIGSNSGYLAFCGMRRSLHCVVVALARMSLG